LQEGNVPLRTTTGTDVILENVLLVPGLAANLISFTRIMEKECAIRNNRRGVYVFHSWNELLLTGTECKGMLKMNVQQGCHREPLLSEQAELKLEREPEVNKDDATASTTAWPAKHIYRHVTVLYAGVSDPRSKASLSTWHKRLGHVNKDYVRRTAGATEGMIITSEEAEPKAADCVDCVRFKLKQQHFPPSSSREKQERQVLDLVHTDIAYALPETAKGEKYLLVLVDDASKHTWGFPLVTRSTDEILPILRTWLRQATAQHYKKLKTLRADSAGEYTSDATKAMAAEEGFRLEYSTPKAHQQNGVAERTIQTVRAGMLATLEQSGLTKEFWTYALDHHLWGVNRTINQSNPHHTPFELWMGYAPSLAPARTFGSMALNYIPQENRARHEPKGAWGVSRGDQQEQEGLDLPHIPRRKTQGG